jgi:hypothetical protein
VSGNQQPRSIEAMVGAALEHAEKATDLLGHVDDGESPGATKFLAGAQVHATLAEAYARLASTLVVNAASLHAAVEAQQQGRAGRSDA